VLHLIQAILDWSEAWALFIPLVVLTNNEKQCSFTKPVIIYLWTALIINLFIDVSWKFRKQLPETFQSNNYLYNLHSVIRLLLFAAFFIKLRQPYFRLIKKLIPLFFLTFTFINFYSYENFFNKHHLSSRLLSVETVLLLFYCLQYYFSKLQETIQLDRLPPDFWIVTGLSVYVVVNFFIFLLYNKLTVEFPKFAVSIWNVHNVSFIILNIFLAKAFYVSDR
jgi:hypothetical protein